MHLFSKKIIALNVCRISFSLPHSAKVLGACSFYSLNSCKLTRLNNEIWLHYIKARRQTHSEKQNSRNKSAVFFCFVFLPKRLKANKSTALIPGEFHLGQAVFWEPPPPINLLFSLLLLFFSLFFFPSPVPRSLLLPPSQTMIQLAAGCRRTSCLQMTDA